MDLRAYYRRIRSVEAAIPGEYALVVSKETQDGGQAGIVSEVPRYMAAKLVVEDRARLATEDEGAEFRGRVAEAVARQQKSAEARAPEPEAVSYRVSEKSKARKD